MYIESPEFGVTCLGGCLLLLVPPLVLQLLWFLGFRKWTVHAATVASVALLVVLIIFLRRLAGKMARYDRDRAAGANEERR